MEGLDDRLLDFLAAAGVDGMSNIGMQLHASIHILPGPVFGEFPAAVVAELGPEMIFTAAFAAMIAHFA